MLSYAKVLKSHLAAYKVSRLGVQEAGTFVHKGRVLRFAHILPRDLRWLNILEPVRAEVRQYFELRPDLKLHKFFHHLNSSQAFALNLFYPFFEQSAASVLLRAMQLRGEVSAWQPEYIADPREGTNVDVMWQSPHEARTFCEVKLTEQDFGAAKDDGRHRRKLDEIYGPVLAGQCSPELLEPALFFENYQFLRNVWLAARDPEATVIFLVPRANTALWQRLELLLRRLTPALAGRVRAVAMEDVLTSLTLTINVPKKLAWYAELLREKYIASDSTA